MDEFRVPNSPADLLNEDYNSGMRVSKELAVLGRDPDDIAQLAESEASLSCCLNSCACVQAKQIHIESFLPLAVSLDNMRKSSRR